MTSQTAFTFLARKNCFVRQSRAPRARQGLRPTFDTKFGYFKFSANLVLGLKNSWSKDRSWHIGTILHVGMHVTSHLQEAGVSCLMRAYEDEAFGFG